MASENKVTRSSELEKGNESTSFSTNHVTPLELKTDESPGDHLKNQLIPPGTSASVLRKRNDISQLLRQSY